MATNREAWNLDSSYQIWIGRYKNSQNMPHWHYECEFLYVDKGALNITCNRQNYHITARQSFFIDSKTIHSMSALSPDTEVTLLVFNTGVLDFFAEGLTPAEPMLENFYNVPALYSKLKDEYNGKQPFYKRRALIMLMDFMFEIFRNEKLKMRTQEPNTPERFIELMLDVDKNYADYDFERAAKFMNMNQSYFSRLFHKLTGITFSQYLNYVRCEKAITILNSGEDVTVTEIFNRCGFMTIRSFNRVFKSITGYSPTNLPKGFTLTNKFQTLNETSHNPTLNECLLLEAFD